jgi:hypothetical protein
LRRDARHRVLHNSLNSLLSLHQPIGLHASPVSVLGLQPRDFHLSIPGRLPHLATQVGALPSPTPLLTPTYTHLTKHHGCSAHMDNCASRRHFGPLVVPYKHLRCCFLKMGPIGYPETSVINYHYSLRHEPQRISFRVRYISSRLLPYGALLSLVGIMDQCESVLTTSSSVGINEDCRLWRCCSSSSITCTAN